MSHDLRTPLTSIRGYAEAIADGRVEAGPAAGIILSESQRLERLVADLLDLARLDARRFRLDLVPADVGAIVAAAVEGFRPGGRAVRARPRPRRRRHRRAALVDPDRLGQVVANLLDNGCRLTRPTGCG